MNYFKTHLKLAIAVLLLWGCAEPFERIGRVIEEGSGQPVQGLSVDIYMKTQVRDSLQEEVFTDSRGYFQVKEKRSSKTLFLLSKPGYIGFTSSLPLQNDTIYLEKEN